MRILVTGEARLAYFLCRRLASLGHHLTVIHPDLEVCRAFARDLSATVVHGDPTDPRVLGHAEAETANEILALTTSDERNLAICQLAKLRFGVARTLAIANDPDNEAVFRALGVGIAFAPIRVLASLVEQRALFEDVTTLLPLAGGTIQMAEMQLGATAPAAGRTLRELTLPPGALVAYVIRDGIPVVPRGETRLHVGDRLLVIAQPDQAADALRELTGADR
jgi:trk system potassium uptake protein TrkA